ncbi:hypothetical protein JB92DRAFT_3131728 [Gautieria morchelliformis]|nr:hypothetical protein JB92DRAFT_3131728 [Gautieria morchelliformis]
MSPKPCTRGLAGWLHSQRYYHNSANSQKYDPKVSGEWDTLWRAMTTLDEAIPFAISADEAIYQSSIRACYHVRNHDGLADAVLSRIFSANKPPRPLKIEPVYFPTWLVDAEVTAKVSEHNANSTVQTQATAQSLAIYMPGFDHFPLSLLRFRFNPETTSLCSTTDEGFGSLPSSNQRITCLPYTLSPFALPKAARSLSLEQAKIDSTLRIEPESIRFPLVRDCFDLLSLMFSLAD